jgi:molecular chaperone GrpE
MEEVRQQQGVPEDQVTVDNQWSAEHKSDDQISPGDELQRAIERANHLEASWRRGQADLANYRKQAEREREEQSALANAILIKDILSILDDLDRALASVAEQLRAYTWVDGVWLIQRKLEAILKSHGLEEIAALGQHLDPMMHQAVSEVDGDPGKVIAVVQKGYTVRSRLLRPTLVVVGRETSPHSTEELDEQKNPSTSSAAENESDPS